MENSGTQFRLITPLNPSAVSPRAEWAGGKFNYKASLCAEHLALSRLQNWGPSWPRAPQGTVQLGKNPISQRMLDKTFLPSLVPVDGHRCSVTDGPGPPSACIGALVVHNLPGIFLSGERSFRMRYLDCSEAGSSCRTLCIVG